MKKGFTLIELLAVIVILAIIAVIAIPIVLDIIDDTKKNSILRSAEMYLDTVELSISRSTLKGQNIPSGQYKIKDGDICLNDDCTKKIDVEANGKIPNSGIIIIREDGTVLLDLIVIDGYSCYNTGKNNNCIKASKKENYSTTYRLMVESNSETTLSNYRIYGNSFEDKYQAVEYIESVGKQYIDTGIIPNQNTGFEIEFLVNNPIDSSGYGTILGARKNSKSNEFHITTYSSDTTTKLGTLRFGNSEYNAGIVTKTKMKLILMNKTYTNNDGVEHNLTETFTAPSTLTIFALNQNGNVAQWSGTQLYSLKIYDGDTLIRDFVPCYRKSDKEVGLYDLVENKFYTNQGLDKFLKGADVSNDAIPSIEYPNNIVSTGNKVKIGEETKYEIPITVYGKNLFDINRSKSSVSMGASNKSPRIFEFDKFYIGFSSNNYKYGSYVSISPNLDVITDNIFISNGLGGYGVGFPIKVKSNTNYVLYYGDCEDYVGIGTYDKYGIYLGEQKPSLDQDKKIATFKTGANVEIISIVLIPTEKNVYKEYKNIQLEEGTNLTTYEPANKKSYSIYLDEPLRCVGEVCDYIDYKSQKVVIQIGIVDNHFVKLEEPKYESIELPEITISKGASHIMVETTIAPSKIEVEYYN